MSYKVYRLTTYDTYGNAFACNRHETWSIAVDRSFNDMDDAAQYVICQNSKSPQFKNLALGLVGEQRDKFAVKFSTSKKYLDECRWFLGKPPIDKIKKLLIGKGIEVN